MLGKLLKERYQIIHPLSAGAFGQTYVAIDTYQPEKPKCVVKHLKGACIDNVYLQTVRHRFIKETEVLSKLHNYANIPNLLASFEEEQEFYIVQEFIEGDSLNTELPFSNRFSQYTAEEQCIKMLQEILGILDYIHSQGIIHGDIKPNNLIRRASDGALFLLDFGTAQPIHQSLINQDIQLKKNLESFINNPELLQAGYIAPEQLLGCAYPASDIYAAGMMAIMALGGKNQTEFKLASNTVEIVWQLDAQVNDKLASVINQMVRYNYQERYQSAVEVLSALHNIYVNNSELKSSYFSFNFFKQNHNSSQKQFYNSAHRVSVIGNLPEDCLPMEAQEQVFDIKAQLIEKEVISTEDTNVSSGASSLAGFIGVGAGIAANTMLIGLGVYALQIALVPESEEDVFNQAQQEYQTGNLEKAITLAQSISSNSNVYPEAQAAIVEWRKNWNTAEAKFIATKQAFSQSRWVDVFQAARDIPNIQFWQLKIEPVVAQARVLMEAHAIQLLQTAYNHAEQKDFTTALNYLKQIPPETQLGQKVQEKLVEYSQKQNIRASYFLQKAYNSAAKYQFKAAIKYLKQIPKGTPAYTKAQGKIAEYTQKQLLIASE